jgi:phytoene dehydrogenase-like protein
LRKDFTIKPNFTQSNSFKLFAFVRNPDTESYVISAHAVRNCTTRTETLLNFVEKEIPGFKELVEYTELSTPLTSEHFTSHPRGQIYGLPATPARIDSELTGAKTPIHGLYNVGADVMGHGIIGAMTGSLMAIASTLGWSTLGKIMGPKR